MIEGNGEEEEPIAKKRFKIVDDDKVYSYKITLNNPQQKSNSAFWRFFGPFYILILKNTYTHTYMMDFLTSLKLINT